MRLLFVFRHLQSVEPFVRVIERSLARGHTVRVLTQDATEKVPALFQPHPELSFASFVLGRADEWRDIAPLLRIGRDYLQYLGAPYRDARKLRNRAFERLLYQLGVPHDDAPRGAAEAALHLPADAVARLNSLAARYEHLIPSDPIHERCLLDFRPDAVLASPLVHFGSAQADFVKAAQALGIPVGMLLFSWDNLSTKGALHVQPDRLFVWNERQRQEAWELHGMPQERTRVTGAPRFDRFFELRPLLTREAFCAPFDLDPSKTILLYLCSSRLVSEREPAFIRQWRERLRQSADASLREAILIVRPHPDLPVQEKSWLGPEQSGRWSGNDITYRARRMFGDRHTVMLYSESARAAVLHECLYHSRAAVGLNTSAEIEAGIVGRPVFTVLVDESYADGQQSTLHFSYLMADQGGWVTASSSLDDHEQRLVAELSQPPRAERIQEAVGRFVRPCGWNVPASQVVVDAIESNLRRVDVEPRTQRPVSVAVRPSAPATNTASRRLPSGEDARLVQVEYDAATLWIASSNPQEADRARIASRSPWILAWLPEVAAAGSPFYVIGAQGDALALIAARALGATVFVFEPDIPTLARLWENTLLNECDGNLVPMPVAVGSKRVLEEQRSAAAAPAAARFASRRRMWREHPGWPSMVVQPRLALPLDSVLKTWELPPPRALYLGPAAPVAQVLQGAKKTLESGVTAMLIESSTREAAPAIDALTSAGFAVHARGTQPDAASGDAIWLVRISGR